MAPTYICKIVQSIAADKDDQQRRHASRRTREQSRPALALGRPRSRFAVPPLIVMASVISP